MLGSKIIKLIIVCDERTEVYANYLRQLISTNDDKDGELVGIKDGTVDVAVWLEKEYVANKPQISSNEHILFVGNSKTSKSESSSMQVKFDRFGMKYGWLGKRGIMVVDDAMLSPDTYDEFIEFCTENGTEFERIAMKRIDIETLKDKGDQIEIDDESNSKGKLGIAFAKAKKGLIAGTAAAGEKIVPALGVEAGINRVQSHKKIKDQQYRALSVIYYRYGLNDFLEG